MRGSTTRYWSRVIGLASRMHGLRPEAIRVRGHGGRYRLTVYTTNPDGLDAREVARTIAQHTGAEISEEVEVVVQERGEEDG